MFGPKLVGVVAAGTAANLDGCTSEVFLAGTVSGVGMAPPVGKIGPGTFNGGLLMPPIFCFAI